MISSIEKLFKTTEIHDNVVWASALLEQQTKQAYHLQSAFIRDFLKRNPKANAYQLKSLTSEILTYWNKSINPDVETFWIEMRRSNIDFERKEPIRFALEKGRFGNVEQSIDAKIHWNLLKHFSSITAKYTQVEIKQIDSIIQYDEEKRHDVLKKCLEKKSIPQTQYLKFGEAMAYFERCNLFLVYFSKKQFDGIYEIWKHFKYQ